MTIPENNIQDAIRKKAVDLGFDDIAITQAEPQKPLRARLEDFIQNNHHGSMAWMENRIVERSHPKSLWPDAKSVIMLAMNYGPDHNPLQYLQDTSNGLISVYAQNNDYHDVIKKRLKQLARWMVAEWSCDVKVFVDTAPVMEKPLAEQAGLGWQGKHTNLVSREFGSWLFLGSIFTTLKLPSDKAHQDHCGNCQNCLDACPTNAFPAPYKIDAKRCISYLTIEHKGPIPEEFRQAIGNRIYGCDDCLAVCPWNKFAKHASEAAFHARDSLNNPSLDSLLRLDDTSFRAMFTKSPIKRIGRNRFIRNVLIAAGNSHNCDLIPPVETLTHDDDETVRITAQWALTQLRQTTPR